MGTLTEASIKYMRTEITLCIGASYDREMIGDKNLVLNAASLSRYVYVGCDTSSMPQLHVWFSLTAVEYIA